MPARNPTDPRQPDTAGLRSPSFRLDTILVPVDFSECSLKALDYGVSLAQRLGASVTLLHCVEPLHSGSLLEQKKFRRLHGDLARQAQHRVAELAKERVKPFVPVKHYVREGAAAEAIVKLAGKARAHLIVLGTHGHTGWKHALLGSVTERVIRHSHCPVLTVRG